MAALAWNPLVLFETAGNAHNDVLAITFSLLALVCLVQGRSTLAGGSFALGALVKYLPGVGLAWLLWAMLWGQPPLRRRSALPLVVLVLAISVALTVPRLELPDSLDPLIAETTANGSVNVLTDMLTTTVLDRLTLDSASRARSRDLARVLTLAAFAVYLLWEARYVSRNPNANAIAAANARSCLVFIVLISPTIQPWYYSLSLALAVVLGASRTLGRLAIGYTLLALPVLYLHYYLREATPGWVDVLYGFAPLLPILLQTRPRQSRPNPVAAATCYGSHSPRVGCTVWSRPSSTLSSRCAEPTRRPYEILVTSSTHWQLS